MREDQLLDRIYCDLPRKIGLQDVCGAAGTGSGTSSVTLRATPAAPKEAVLAGKGWRDIL